MEMPKIPYHLICHCQCSNKLVPFQSFNKIINKIERTEDYSKHITIAVYNKDPALHDINYALISRDYYVIGSTTPIKHYLIYMRKT